MGNWIDGAAVLLFSGTAIIFSVLYEQCKEAQTANAQAVAPHPFVVNTQRSNFSKKSDPLVKLHVGQLI